LIALFFFGRTWGVPLAAQRKGGTKVKFAAASLHRPVRQPNDCCPRKRHVWGRRQSRPGQDPMAALLSKRACFDLVLLREKNHASDIDGVGFGRCCQSLLLSKCIRCSGRRSSHEACCKRWLGARGAVLRASHPARRHQVLPAIRRRAARLPPLLSLVVVATFKSGDVRFGSKADVTL
jgi:hypothetical protein